MFDFIEKYLLNQAFANVKEFLDYAGYEGEAMIGWETPAGYEIDNCILVTDDEGQPVFTIYVESLDTGLFYGVMCEDHTAPGKHENFREKYTKSSAASPLAIVRWGLGI